MILRLNTYSLSKALKLLDSHSNGEISEINDIYQLAKQRDLILSLRVKRGVLRPACIQDKIDEVEKTKIVRSGKYLKEDLNSQDYKDKTARIHKLGVESDIFFEEAEQEIVFEILKLSKTSLCDNQQKICLVDNNGIPSVPRDLFDEELIRLAIWYADEFSPSHGYGEGKPFLSDGDSVVITRENLAKFMGLVSEDNEQIEKIIKTTPVKGKPETQKQRVLEELRERNLSLSDNPEYGVMKEIKKALVDDSDPKLAETTIDKLFADIGLVSGHNTQKK